MHRLIGIAKGYKIRELKPVLRDLDLPVSGKVAAMQDRLIASMCIMLQWAGQPSLPHPVTVTPGKECKR